MDIGDAVKKIMVETDTSFKRSGVLHRIDSSGIASFRRKLIEKSGLTHTLVTAEESSTYEPDIISDKDSI